MVLTETFQCILEIDPFAKHLELSHFEKKIFKINFVIRNTKNMLNSHAIIAKRSKNIFQPADPTILPETPQIPALSGAHLRDGLNLSS
jgi:hypothetical protein